MVERQKRRKTNVVRNERFKKSGVSLIALVITIIVVIILAAIMFGTSTRTITNANYSDYVNNVSEVYNAFHRRAVTIKGQEAAKGNNVTDAQVYHYLADNSGEFEVRANIPPYTVIKDENQIGMKLPKMKVESGTGKMVTVKYAVTNAGDIITWPPFDYEEQYKINDKTNAVSKVNPYVTVGDTKIALTLSEDTKELLNWDGVMPEIPDEPIEIVEATSADWEYNVDANGVGTLTKYIGAVPSNGILVVPNQVDGKSMTILGNGSSIVLGNRTDITGIQISRGIEKINDKAFYQRSTLAGSLVIPNTVTSIGDYAFYYCRGFTGDLIIPNNVINIGNSAFNYCDGFNGSLTIGNNVTNIGNSAFTMCKGFTGSLTIPDSVTSIGDYAFNNCSGFTGNLTIPNSVTSIGNSAFEGCKGFSGDLTIPNTVTSIGNRTFSNCGFTGGLTIPDGVTSIGDRAFYDCKSFTGNLTIPDSVTSIGNYAFYMCQGFNGTLTIGNGVKSIGNYAFNFCNYINRNDLILPNGLTSIGEHAFHSCTVNSITVPDSVTTIGNVAFMYIRHIYYTGEATGSPWGAYEVN